MELPIFNDNLRSSASWNSILAREEEAWRGALAAGDLRAVADARIRDRQVEQMGRIAGNEIDAHRLCEAVAMVTAWARETTEGGEAGARLDTARLLELHRVLIGA